MRAVTADGTEVNIKMFKNLGMALDCPSFMHPCDSSVNTYGICDACHMLKLVWNTLADLKILWDGDNKNVIKWSYVQHLVDIQETSGIRAANKVSVHHVNFHKHKMKVKLECGPMPNLMVALPNIGGALCSTPQSMADAHY